MNTQIATESVGARSRRSVRALAVSSLGPLTVLAGAVWGVLQPWRLTLLHPRGQGFWWLFAEPPLLVAAAGLAFALLVAPGLLADLEDGEGRA
ncbi:MAG TPA: hypothetical protein VIU86_09350 [Gaiellaceae bacterium]